MNPQHVNLPMMFSGFDAKLDPTLQANLPLRPGGFRGQHICTDQSKNTTAHATRHKSYKMDYNRVKNLDQFLATLIMDNTQ